jgi:hypothetical protein
MNPLNNQTFTGRSTDDPYEFIETVEVLAGHATLGPIPNETTCRVYFRTGLGGKAKEWYTNLPRETRQDWGKLKDEFVKEFDVSRRELSVEESYRVTSQIIQLQQGPDQSIVDYVEEATQLNRKCPPHPKQELARRFLAGLQDDNVIFRAQARLENEESFTFKQAKAAVMKATRPLGKPSPFDIERPKEEDQKEISQNDINLKVKDLLTQLAAQRNKEPPISTPAPPYQPMPPNPFRPQGNGSKGHLAAGVLGGKQRNLTCYNCMAPGHIAPNCMEPPVPWQQKQANRTKLEGQVEVTQQPYGGPPRTVGAAPAILVRTPSPLGQGQRLEEDEGGNEYLAMPVASGRVQKARRADNAEAKKRQERLTADSPLPVQTRSRTRSQTLSPTPEESVSMDLAEDAPPAEDPEPPTGLRVPYVTPGTGGRQGPVGQTRNARTGGAGETPQAGGTRPAAPKETIPINLASGRERFDIREFLYNTHITMPIYQLLDRSPQIRAQMAKQLQSSRATRRGKQVRFTPGTAHAAQLAIEDAEDEEGQATCLYVEATVDGIQVTRVLVDTGAVVELISPSLVHRLRNKTVHRMTENWSLRLADDRTVAITNYVMLEVVVGGVRAVIRAYVMGANQTFELLLSKSWMQRVRAIEDHGNKTLTIHSKNGTASTVVAAEATPHVHELITEASDPMGPGEEGLAEEELAKLTEELDEFELYHSGNGKRL